MILDNGDIQGWRNGGNQASGLPEFWENLGIVSSGKTFPDLEGIRFVDVSFSTLVLIYVSKLLNLDRSTETVEMTSSG